MHNDEPPETRGLAAVDADEPPDVENLSMLFSC
jgi:hypothetical protein